MVIGVTGHQMLPEERGWIWVEEAIREALAQASYPLTGISSLALGADQLFAELVLECGGALCAVLPFPSYAETFPPGSGRSRYAALLARAASVEGLSILASEEESYLAAGRRVVEACDWMIAVWNDGKAAGLGGTGDVVRYARQVGRTVLHLNPGTRKVQCLHGEG